MNKKKPKSPHKQNISLILGLLIIVLLFFLLVSSEMNKTQRELTELKNVLANNNITVEEDLSMIENRYKLDVKALGLNGLTRYLKADVNFKTTKTCQEIINAKDNNYHNYYSFLNSLELLQVQYSKDENKINYIRDSLITYNNLVTYIKDSCHEVGYIIP